jgi:hypothetical protein
VSSENQYEGEFGCEGEFECRMTDTEKVWGETHFFVAGGSTYGSMCVLVVWPVAREAPEPKSGRFNTTGR